MLNTIIVAVDGSVHAENALRLACDIAARYKATLHLVHSPQIDSAQLVDSSGAFAAAVEPSNVAEAGQRVMQQAIAMATELGCTPGERIIGNADPAHEILHLAKVSNADLLVTGRRGKGGLSSLLLGSVSHKVSQEAPCACMTVK